MEAIVGMRGEKAMRPHFMGGRHSFTVSDHIPSVGRVGGGLYRFWHTCPTLHCDITSVPFNALQILALGQVPSAHFSYPRGLPDWSARALRRCNGALAIHADGVPYFRKMGAQEHSY